MGQWREDDMQRGKLYKAERRAWAKLPGKRFETMPEIETYLTRVYSHQWFKEHFPKCRVFEVRDGGGRRSAMGMAWRDKAFMRFPRWSRSEWIILHELAHALNDMHGRARAPAHGWEFAWVYVRLVQHYMGAVAVKLLKAEFRAGKVRWRPKKKCRPMTDEERRVACERLAAARTKIGTKGE